VPIAAAVAIARCRTYSLSQVREQEHARRLRLYTGDSLLTNLYIVFFICFRECLETSIIVSVLLAFLKQTLGPEHDAAVHKRLVRQIWWGVGLGVLICLIICAGVIGTFYTAGRNSFESAENIWEGVFGILASLIITLMGAALLRVSKLQDKWRVKISKVLEQKDSKLPIKGKLKAWSEKYAMFILPFVTVLREGIEAVL
jgi:high-affinity iron transporter